MGSRVRAWVWTPPLLPTGCVTFYKNLDFSESVFSSAKWGSCLSTSGTSCDEGHPQEAAGTTLACDKQWTNVHCHDCSASSNGRHGADPESTVSEEGLLLHEEMHPDEALPKCGVKLLLLQWGNFQMELINTISPRAQLPRDPLSPCRPTAWGSLASKAHPNQERANSPLPWCSSDLPCDLFFSGQQSSCLEGTQGSHSLGCATSLPQGWDARRTKPAKHMDPQPRKVNSWPTG